MPVVSAENWAARLGLARTALFGFESLPFSGHHFVLLNGVKGSFLLSAVEDEQPTSTYRDWAWSANVRHHVAIQDHSVVVTAPTKSKQERFELSQVERVLDRFFRYLEADESTPSVSVVDHFVRLFRSHQAASDAEIGCEAPKLATFLTLLAAHMFPREASKQDAFCRRVGLDVSIRSTIREQYADRFREELQTNPITQLSLSLPIAIRHAGGALFQETHAEVSSANQLTLFGLPAAHRKSLILTSGAYYTPPGLARAIAELTIQPHLARPEITLLDPACGSGLFLCEAVRALQRAEYRGAIRVYGFDIDEAAVQMAKFSLGCAFTDWPERFQFEIRQEDFLRLGRLPAANVVVMNPPFRKWKMLQPEERDVITESLGDLYKGRPDLAMVFVSKALSNLAGDGTLGTLLPLGILSSESGLKWRQSLLEQGNLRFISSLGDHSLFSNAIVSVTTMILDRGENDPNRQISLLWSSERPNAASEALRHFRRNRVGGGSLDERSSDWAFYRVNQEDFRKRKVWIPLPNSIGPLLQRISDSCPQSVSDIFVVRQGIRTGCREAFILNEKELLSLPKPEREYFWPVAENQTISGGQILPGRHIFYGGSIEKEADLIERCPTYRERYLLPNLDKLKARKGVSREKYWVLTRPREWLPKREARLVSKMFGTTDAFGLDADGRFAIVQANGWFPRRGKAPGSGAEKATISQDTLARLFGLQAYLELLNSRVFYMIVREYSVGVAGGQYELAPKYVNAMPMPDLWPLLDRDPYATELARRATEANGREERDQFAAYAYGTAIEDWPDIG